MAKKPLPRKIRPRTPAQGANGEIAFAVSKAKPLDQLEPVARGGVGVQKYLAIKNAMAEMKPNSFIEIAPPKGMSAKDFAKRLIAAVPNDSVQAPAGFEFAKTRTKNEMVAIALRPKRK